MRRHPMLSHFQALLGCALILVVWARPSGAQIGFFFQLMEESYQAELNSTEIKLWDLDGDSNEDMVVCNDASNNISVWRDIAEGNFGARTDFPTGTGPISLDVADVNGDGKADVVVANNGANTISVLLGN